MRDTDIMSQKIFSNEKIARYLTNRLRSDFGAKKQKLSDEIKNADAAAKSARVRRESPDPVEIAGILSRLSDLAAEKEDLLRQITLDETHINRGVSSWQDNIQELLGSLPDIEGINIRSSVSLMDIDRAITDSADEAARRLDSICAEIRELLSDPLIENAYMKKKESAVRNIRIARNAAALQTLAEKYEIAGLKLVARRNSNDLSVSSADIETLKTYRAAAGSINKKTDDLLKDEEIYYEFKRRGLLEYRRQLMKGGFVKTASVRNEIMQILIHLHLGIPVFLRGHLGVGKTELALHVCREYLKAEPEFISGSEEATKYDIYGKTQIGTADEQERLREFEKRISDYRGMNPDAGEKDIREAERRYYEAIVVRAQAGSFFQFGPLVRAMKEGKPLIIDEMDGIPHSILMRINHALTRRAGDRVRIQEAGGEEMTVRPGFCVIATGNVKSARYRREELDAAFLSRWWSVDIKYPPQNEMYEILSAALIDRRGNMQLKSASDMEDLKRLTEAAAEIQRIFTGDHLDFLGEGADAARGISAGLKKSVLSLRHLWNIIRPWKANNYEKPLEHYILTEFIKPAVAEDQVYLVQLFSRFRFFKTWTAGQFDIAGLNEKKLMAFQGRQA